LIPDVYIMLDFLMMLAKQEKPKIGKHVVIIFGGLKDLEVARKCLTLGASKVTIVSHFPIFSLPKEFQDTKALRKEGIDIRSSTTVAAMGGVSNHMDRIALEKEDPRLGASREQEIMEADTIIVSAGRLPEMVFVPVEEETESKPEEIKWQTIETFRTFPQGGDKGIFSSPEPGRISDSSAVVKSILSGRRLVRGIHQHFTDELITPIRNLTCEKEYVLDVTEVHDVVSSERQIPVVSDVEGDSKTAWIFPEEFPGLDEQAARKEAERCLKCGLICYMKSQVKESERNNV